MSVAEAAAALGATEYLNNGPTEILTFPMQSSKGGTPMTQEAMYAAQLWNYWKIMGAGAGTTALGAAASAAKSWASGVLIGDPVTAGTLAETGGLLTMSLPAVAAAAAPLCGVSLGKSLYDLNPNLWTQISETLLPFAYDETSVFSAVVDKLGQVHIARDAILALRNLFINLNIGEVRKEYQVEDVSGVVSPLIWREINEGFRFEANGTDYVLVRKSGSGPIRLAFYAGNAGNYIFEAASDTSSSLQIYNEHTQGWGMTFSATTPFTNDNKIVYVNYAQTASESYINMLRAIVQESAIQELASNLIGWILVYGESVSTGTYPTGTSKWEGDQVDLDNMPKIDVITKADGYTRPYYPISIPIGDPIESPDPAIQPSPAPAELPQLDPYISPKPGPEQWPETSPDPDVRTAPQKSTDPVYVPEPNLTPSADPSAELAPDPEPAPSPPSSPTPGGSTPSIIFPPVSPDPFPSPIPASGSGLVHVYNPTPAEFIAFGNWLWVTYADPSIEKLWNNPFDGIIGAHELYATPSKDATDTIKSGFLDSGISSTVVQNRYTSINCGSILIPEYWGNYLDYSPYSKAYVYLPFIGIVEVDVDDIVGHAINIVYHVDSYNGSCIAQITVAKDNYVNTIYQFSGNCAVDVPLAGGSQAAIRAAMIGAAAYGIGSAVNGVINGATRGAMGGAGGAIAGGLLGGATGAIGGLAAGVANVVSQKSSVQHSGSFGASYGAMGIKKPYIILRRPIQKVVNGYEREYGYPAHTRVVIGACTGYLRVIEVNVQSTLATDEEKAKIEELLKAGVYVD